MDGMMREFTDFWFIFMVVLVIGAWMGFITYLLTKISFNCTYMNLRLITLIRSLYRIEQDIDKFWTFVGEDDKDEDTVQ